MNLLETVSPCLRGCKKPSRIRFATTPRKGTVWNRWFTIDLEDKEIINCTMNDNKFLSVDDIELQRKAIKDENAYKQEILGEILDDDIDFCIIKKSDYPIFRKQPFGLRRLGIDCSGSGGDFNVFVVSDDNGIIEIVREQIADTYKLYNIAKELITKHNVMMVNIDCTGGFGNGLADMLEHNGYKVGRINFGQKANDEIYVNARAEMYFNLAEKIRNGFFIDDEKIKEELSYTTYQINGSGKTMLVPKTQIKELIGRSPDTSDALALSLYNVGVILSPTDSLNIALKFSSI